MRPETETPISPFVAKPKEPTPAGVPCVRETEIQEVHAARRGN